MKIAVIADTHIHPFTAFSTGSGADNSRVQVSLDALDQVLKYCIANHIGTLVHAGDLFHARDHQRYPVFNVVYDKLRKMSDWITMHLIAGNHDVVDKQGTLSIHAFENSRVKEEGNEEGDIYVYGPNSQLCLDEVEGTGIVFIPYTTDFERLNEELGKLPADTCIIGHLDVQGAGIGSAMFPSPVGLDRALLHKFKAVLLGHYHKPQHLGGNAYYVGSLTPVDFSDKDQGGVFSILDTETGQIGMVPIKCPRFIEIDQDWDQDFSFIRGNYIRMRREQNHGTEEWLRLAEPAGVEWIPIVAETESTSRIENVGQLNWPELVERYVEVKDPQLDRAKLIKTGMELLT